MNIFNWLKKMFSRGDEPVKLDLNAISGYKITTEQLVDWAKARGYESHLEDFGCTMVFIRIQKR